MGVTMSVCKVCFFCLSVFPCNKCSVPKAFSFHLDTFVHHIL